MMYNRRKVNAKIKKFPMFDNIIDKPIAYKPYTMPHNMFINIQVAGLKNLNLIPSLKVKSQFFYNTQNTNFE